MKDPSLNVIKPVFGKDVEEVAKIGPPRQPNIPADLADGIAAKISALSI